MQFRYNKMWLPNILIQQSIKNLGTHVFVRDGRTPDTQDNVKNNNGRTETQHNEQLH